MIRNHLQGNIFNCTTTFIVNPVNLQGISGLGLAKAFAERHPRPTARYKQFCNNGGFKVGMLYSTFDENRGILFFPTKNEVQTYGQGGSLQLVELGLRNLAETYQERGIKDITFPMIGCGAGGLDWESQVYPLIVNALGGLDLVVDIITP